MQIVIDIPKRIYKIVQNKTLNLIDSEILTEAVKNGTSLPEGHGRLGDLDKLEEYVIEKYSEGEQLAIDISDAPTIIEADKEE